MPSTYQPEISMGMSRGTNVSEYNFDRNMSRNPESIISIFTVNTRKQFSASGKCWFEGRDKNERYHKVASISDPKNFVDNVAIDGQKDQHKVTTDDGKWVAMDWLNPQNIYSLDQDYEVEGSIQDGTNLLSRGLFFIVRPFNPVKPGNVNDLPTEDEIAAAEKRMGARYNALIQVYNRTSQSDPKNMQNILSEEMIDALNWGGLQTPHNTTMQQKVPCPTCGDMKLASAKFHKSESLGVVCIEPTTDGWKAAVNAGLKTRADVPEGLGWPGRA